MVPGEEERGWKEGRKELSFDLYMRTRIKLSLAVWNEIFLEASQLIKIELYISLGSWSVETDSVFNVYRCRIVL